jgi:hypothetical protein
MNISDKHGSSLSRTASGKEKKSFSTRNQKSKESDKMEVSYSSVARPMSPDHNGNAGKSDRPFSSEAASLVAAAAKFPNFNFSSLGNGGSPSALNLTKSDDQEFSSKKDLISQHLQGKKNFYLPPPPGEIREPNW